MDADRARSLCANTCKHTACTGTGSTSRWAHRCQLRPDLLPELAPVFTTREVPPSPRPSPSDTRTPHEYGPHDPGTAPQTVTVLAGGVRHGDTVTRYPQTVETTRPAALLAQRAALNRRAAG